MYFPEGSNWYDFYSGAFFSGKSVTVIENEMDDLVPLYLREGHMTFTQNVDNITKSSQLGN